MSAMPPIPTELMRHNKTSQGAISGLTQCNKRLRAGRTRDVVCSIRLGAGFAYFLRYSATSPIEERRMTLT